MMNNERFFDLAMKVIGQQATDVERAELDALMAQEPAMRAEFNRLQADVRLAKDVLPLMDATKAVGEKLPSYARGRLQTKVRQTLGHPTTKQEPDRSLAWGWRAALGLASVTAMIIFVGLLIFRPPSGPVVQVAMLNTVGTIRGAETNETEILKQQWKSSSIQTFDQSGALESWETNWPTGNKMMVKVIYNRAAGEVRVLLHKGNKSEQKNFVIEQDLATALQKANDFIHAQLGNETITNQP